MTVCYYHVTYAFQSESTLYSCLNVKELLARNRRGIWTLSDNHGIRTHNHLVRKRTLNHLAKPILLNGWVSVYELSSCGFELVTDTMCFPFCWSSPGVWDILWKRGGSRIKKILKLRKISCRTLAFLVGVGGGRVGVLRKAVLPATLAINYYISIFHGFWLEVSVHICSRPPLFYTLSIISL